MPANALFNTITSLGLLLTGLIIHFFRRPKIFEEHSYTRYSFQFWVLRWWFLALEWTLFPLLPTHGVLLRFLALAIVDLGQMTTLAFCLSFLSGKELGTKWLTVLVLVFGVLTIWNLRYLNSQELGPAWFHDPLWFSLSEITAASTNGLIALAIAWRYKYWAIPIIPAQLLQLTLQVFGYRAIFGAASCSVCLHSLAWAKMLSGGLFYMMIFLPSPTGNFEHNFRPFGPLKQLKVGNIDFSPFLKFLNSPGVRVVGFILCGVGTSAIAEHPDWFLAHKIISMVVLLALGVIIHLLSNYLRKHSREPSGGQTPDGPKSKSQGA